MNQRAEFTIEEAIQETFYSEKKTALDLAIKSLPYNPVDSKSLIIDLSKTINTDIVTRFSSCSDELASMGASRINYFVSNLTRMCTYSFRSLTSLFKDKAESEKIDMTMYHTNHDLILTSTVNRNEGVLYEYINIVSLYQNEITTNITSFEKLKELYEANLLKNYIFKTTKNDLSEFNI